MLIEREIKARRFEADQEGINNLKNQFLDEARQFLYFRKGKWNGFEASLQHTATWAENHPELPLTATSKHPVSDKMSDEIARAISIKKEEVSASLKDHYTQSYSEKAAITFRALVVEGGLKGSDFVRWEEISGLKGSIKTVPKAQEGYFRYIVNEKRYAIFCRLDENLLQGIIGYDKETIDLLRHQFDMEFYVSAMKSELEAGLSLARTSPTALKN